MRQRGESFHEEEQQNRGGGTNRVAKKVRDGIREGVVNLRAEIWEKVVLVNKK